MGAMRPGRVTGVGSSSFMVLQKVKKGLEFNNLERKMHLIGG